MGNLVGSILTVAVMFLPRLYVFAEGGLGASALTIADAERSLALPQAIALGVLCSSLGCLAGWLRSSTRLSIDTLLAVIFPIAILVAAGFEQSMTNVHLVPMGSLIKGSAATGFWQTAGLTASGLTDLTGDAFFFKDLLSVTVGNMIAGLGLAGLVCCFIYLQPPQRVDLTEGAAAEILVVEDDPDFVEITSRILARNGYHVRAAVNGEQALQAMRIHQPDLVLLDVMMATPLDGIEMVRTMANDPALAAIPVVMLSSIDGSQCAAMLPEDVRIPIDAWIRKPVDPDHLLTTVKRFHN